MQMKHVCHQQVWNKLHSTTVSKALTCVTMSRRQTIKQLCFITPHASSADSSDSQQSDSSSGSPTLVGQQILHLASYCSGNATSTSLESKTSALLHGQFDDVLCRRANLRFLLYTMTNFLVLLCSFGLVLSTTCAKLDCSNHIQLQFLHHQPVCSSVVLRASRRPTTKQVTCGFFHT